MLWRTGVVLGLLFAGCRSVAPVGLGTTVILVRHAEKAALASAPKDPPLTAEGELRAQALAAMLAAARVTHLFASEYVRTQATLAPLAAATGRPVVVISAADQAALVAALADLPDGAVAVVAGHANTIPELAAALGGEVSGTVATEAGPMLPDDAYDRLFVLHRRGGGQTAVVELRYGAASSRSSP